MSTHAKKSGQQSGLEPAAAQSDPVQPKLLPITNVAIVLSGAASAGTLSALIAPDNWLAAILASVAGLMVSWVVNILWV